MRRLTFRMIVIRLALAVVALAVVAAGLKVYWSGEDPGSTSEAVAVTTPAPPTILTSEQWRALKRQERREQGVSTTNWAEETQRVRDSLRAEHPDLDLSSDDDDGPCQEEKQRLAEAQRFLAEQRADPYDEETLAVAEVMVQDAALGIQMCEMVKLDRGDALEPDVSDQDSEDPMLDLPAEPEPEWPEPEYP